MSGGTLVVSREITNHANFKERLKRIGFTNVHCTDVEKDALNFLIADMKPDILMMNARFHYCATPYRMGLLHEMFPGLYLSAIAIGEFPEDLGMYFILNGVNAFVCTAHGIEEFYDGLEAIRSRRKYIPVSVQQAINARKEYPEEAKKLTRVRTEVLRCISTGIKQEDIADILTISRRTLNHHLQELYRSLNANNAIDLAAAAMELGIITAKEFVYRLKNVTCTPAPEKYKDEDYS